MGLILKILHVFSKLITATVSIKCSGFLQNTSGDPMDLILKILHVFSKLITATVSIKQFRFLQKIISIEL